jgi:hypothetical protein
MHWRGRKLQAVLSAPTYLESQMSHAESRNYAVLTSKSQRHVTQGKFLWLSILRLGNAINVTGFDVVLVLAVHCIALRD